jgi:3-deoxy-D-manno-octulosonic-acid transferase/heptosyltransferase-1
MPEQSPDMKNSTKEGPSARILIIRLSAIGDVVRTLPALSTLRREYPNAHIAWAIEDKASGILEEHPLLDDIIVFERKNIVGALKNPLQFHKGLSLVVQFFRRVRGGEFDLVFDFHGILKSGVIAAMSGSPKRIGFAREFIKEFNHLFTNEKVRPSDPMAPRVERNLELIRPFVLLENVTDKPLLGISERHRQKASAFVEEKFGDSHPVVAIHPGTSRKLKMWFPQQFAALCDMLADSIAAKVVITWGPGEQKDAEVIRSLAKSDPQVGIQTGSLLELAALLERCDLMVTVDSGPMHIGSAVGVPVVAIFGPTDTRVNAPYWPPVEVVVADIECRPCDENCDHARCMEAVTPQMVFDAACRLLTETKAEPRSATIDQ